MTPSVGPGDDRAARATLSQLLHVDDPALRGLGSDATSFTRALLAGESLAGVPDGVRVDPIGHGLRLLTAACRSSVRALIPGDPDWPGLRSGSSSPACLWVRGRGDLRALMRRNVAIIGSRAATDYGRQVAASIAAGLAQRGVTIAVLGGFGIAETVLHTLASASAPGVVVLPAAVAIPHPRALADVFDRVAVDGVLLSAAPAGTSPTRCRMRDAGAVVTALAPVVVVVEALVSSATHAVAVRAARSGARVLAVPGPITSAQSGGCHDLIRAGAATMVCSAEDVLAHLPPGSAGPTN
jgi:DNA processing protein